ncbi:TBC1 domain family member 30 isoform X1 [Ictalurus furcatus]|uniref:TBC1 domain family member 30 isoform X1 n=1 Tax=Ictalurus furcatus TaxID=66913 RepID=UPI002350A236|nr:TBC1 domain family member 30 isoform X1 [Ictalurus furcatus]
MSSIKVPELDLREVDICDGELESEEESGVFGISVGVSLEKRPGLHDVHAHSECTNGALQSFSSKRSRVCDGAVKESVCLSPVRHETWTRSEEDDGRSVCRSSIVDCLLVELYDTYSSGKGLRSVDSLDSSTEASGSDAFLGRSNTASSFLQELQEKHTKRHQRNYLAQKDPEELKWIIQEVNYRIGIQSAKLVRQLKRKDRLDHKQQKKCDIVTAFLQAVSPKRRVDTRLKFTLEPSLGKNGFQQWYDALKAVARLPTGIPKEWRKRVWLTLADQYLHSISIDWEKTMRFAFNERSNPDDDSLGIQIVKDLHRTGCSSYCGQEAEQDRVVLKRVLLAYARWNKTVGYCQGFNVLAALILEVTEGNEGDALKVMIYLIDKVLPESYFANNLRALSVDMAVFRDLLRLKLPELSQHLHHLQKVANRTGGGSYEPPLTNVFTMQWFLTMFATCLPHHTVLKIWDSVFFEGSEVLLRVALAIWAKLAERIEECQTADEFYSTMGCLTQEMLEDNLIDSNELMQTVYSMATFPFPQLFELREKYTYNITPFPAAVKAISSQGLHGWESDDDGDMDDEDSIVTALGCLGPLGGLLAPEIQRYQKHLKDQRGEQSSPCSSMAELSPGAVGAGRSEHHATINSMMMERMSTDIRALTKQYYRIKRRQQQQANLLYIHTGLPVEAERVAPHQPNKGRSLDTDKCPATGIFASQIHSSPVVNHLLLGKKAIAAQHPYSDPTGPHPRAQSTPTQDHSLQSPWRAHVCAHRRNLARARAQLGFDDSLELEENTSPDHKTKTEEGVEEMKEEEDQEKEMKDDRESQEKCDVPLKEPVQGIMEEGVSELQLQDAGCSEEIKEMEQQLSTLDLDSSAQAPSVFNDPETPSPLPEPELGNDPQPQPKPNAQPYVSAVACSTRHDSSSSESTACSLRQSSSVASTPEILPKPPQIFSPFPCVKVPRKSMAARNLGLYGPTSRTPNVHFPHMSKTMNRMGAGVAVSTRW